MPPDSLQFVKGGKGLSSHAAFPRPQKGVPGQAKLPFTYASVNRKG
jgi:hypothetical protein